MKLLIRLSVLALAGFGANELYRKLAPRITGAGDRASTAIDTTLRPAVAEATRSVRATAEFAKNKIGDATADTLEATVDPDAPTSPPKQPAAPVGDSSTSRPLSPMAAKELGLDDDDPASSAAGASAVSDPRG